MAVLGGHLYISNLVPLATLPVYLGENSIPSPKVSYEIILVIFAKWGLTESSLVVESTIYGFSKIK